MTKRVSAMKQANRSWEKLALAFREEIKLWKLSRDEDIVVRMFVACLSERMKGRDPSDLTGTKCNE